ncbi:MAG: DUF3299 domain-containing protein [Planctomycetaceae bacterium]|nr:DUF3299 domain-containing protein [Planctomycetaceae bacterium]MCA9029654.1 DUF3299 domain-containing protein [Planctomycetaceae bacterium]MCA9044815.1 DUF3299 domain-containing protein [Planctomycetaceae bacterium]MCB9950636.1 DUF3299 domain-containing protein [Planctomycetaceae bacterium]
MTQVLEERPTKPDRYSDFGEYDGGSEFSYRPVPIFAVCGFVLALMSTLAVVVWIAIPIAIVALVVSAISAVVISRSRDIYSGLWMAVVGMILPVVCSTIGVAYQVNLYRNEVPDGYQRVSFYKDISEKGFVQDQTSPRLQPPPEVDALDGKKVFLKGYIFPTQQASGLTKFLLLKDNGQCCFGGKPAVQDRITVDLVGFNVDHTYNKVSVSGTFRVNQNFAGDDSDAVYHIDADSCTLSASEF